MISFFGHVSRSSQHKMDPKKSSWDNMNLNNWLASMNLGLQKTRWPRDSQPMNDEPPLSRFQANQRINVLSGNLSTGLNTKKSPNECLSIKLLKSGQKKVESLQ